MSLVHWLVVILVIIVVFGAGRLPNVMGDLAQGIKAFKRGMKDEDEKPDSPPRKVEESRGFETRTEETKVRDTTEV